MYFPLHILFCICKEGTFFMDKLFEINQYLPEKIRERYQYFIQAGYQIEEIRIGAKLPVIFITNKGKINTDIIVSKDEVEEAMEYMTNYSLYSYEKEIKEGFFTLKGGHRIGVAGKAVYEDGILKRIIDISAINIRVCHDYKNNFEINHIEEYIEDENILIISPPGFGKTTLLRKLARTCSDELYRKVVVVDERNEIAGNYNGESVIYIGKMTFVLSGYSKEYGIMSAIRSLSPEYIIVDEIGSNKDMDAIYDATKCGVKVIATVHGKNLEDILDRRWLKKAVDDKQFGRYIIISKDHSMRKVEIYDREFKKIC